MASALTLIHEMVHAVKGQPLDLLAPESLEQALTMYLYKPGGEIAAERVEAIAYKRLKKKLKMSITNRGSEFFSDEYELVDPEGFEEFVREINSTVESKLKLQIEKRLHDLKWFGEHYFSWLLSLHPNLDFFLEVARIRKENIQRNLEKHALYGTRENDTYIKSAKNNENLLGETFIDFAYTEKSVLVLQSLYIDTLAEIDQLTQLYRPILDESE